MKDLVQQSADTVNKMSQSMETLQRGMKGQQDTQNGKLDQVSGQIQSINDSVDEMKARSPASKTHAGHPGPAAVHERKHAGTSRREPLHLRPRFRISPPPHLLQLPTPPRRVKPSAGTPMASNVEPEAVAAPAPAAAPPVDELYKTAPGDYMSPNDPLAASEFGDIVKYYPDHPLAGNAFYYQGEIDYRAGRCPFAINRSFDKVLDQFPDSKQVPVSHPHKRQAAFCPQADRRRSTRATFPHPALPQLPRGHAGPQQA